MRGRGSDGGKGGRVFSVYYRSFKKGGRGLGKKTSEGVSGKL